MTFLFLQLGKLKMFFLDGELNLEWEYLSVGLVFEKLFFKQ